MVRMRVGQSCYALVDNADAARLRSYRWHLAGPPGRQYPSAWIPEYGKRLSMHRLLKDDPQGAQVDHINRNPLDNRRQNLRIANRSQNMLNTGGHRRRRSRYKGVSLHTVRGRGYWRWSFFHDGKRYQGLAPTEKGAARLYDLHASIFGGEFAVFNFPRSWLKEPLE
jgi:hypothetical protein